MDRAVDTGTAAPWVDAVQSLFEQNATLALATIEDGAPWTGRVFFVHDMQSGSRLDLCCAMILGARKSDRVAHDPRVAFVVGGDVPDRWVQGWGRIERVEDGLDADAIVDRLCRRSDEAASFLDRVPWTAVRIRVETLRYTDVASDPPIAELSFA